MIVYLRWVITPLLRLPSLFICSSGGLFLPLLHILPESQGTEMRCLVIISVLPSTLLSARHERCRASCRWLHGDGKGAAASEGCCSESFGNPGDASNLVPVTEHLESSCSSSQSWENTCWRCLRAGCPTPGKEAARAECCH